MKIYAEEPWVKYVFKTFLLSYPEFKQEKEIAVSYGDKSIKNSIIILKGKKHKKILHFDGEKIPIYHVSITKNKKGEIISSYQDDSFAISFDKKNNTIYMNADVLKTSFLLLSRIHEKETPLDNLGRFQAKYTLHKDVTVPLVNEYFRVIYRLISILKRKKTSVETDKKSFWPENAPYGVCLTHDVDNVYKWWPKKILSYIIKKRKISEVIHSIGKGEYLNFDKIMDLESRYGFKSTFFFLTTKKYPEPRYNIKKLKKILKKLDNNGWEVGLHTGFKSFNDFEKLRSEKEKLEKVLGKTVYGLRNHYLRINIPETWKIQSKLGFSYDSTLGFRETCGFRPGYCYPYYPYDFMNEQKIDIIELPMSIMDSALLSKKDPKKEFKRILENVKRFNGLLVINWHNDSFDEKEYPQRAKMYEYILKIIKEDGAYVENCKNVLDYWLNHDF